MPTEEKRLNLGVKKIMVLNHKDVYNIIRVICCSVSEPRRTRNNRVGGGD